jgi:hypothetical protein
VLRERDRRRERERQVTGKLLLETLQRDELRRLQSSLYRIQRIKSRRKTQTGHVALWGWGEYTGLRWRNAGKGCLEDLRINGRIIFKCFKKEKPARRRKHTGIWKNNTKIFQKGRSCLEDLDIGRRIILK